MKLWPFNRDKPEREPQVSEETKAVACRTDALIDRVEALGKETRAVAREAMLVREMNHFGPALVAAFSTPRRHHS